MSNTVIEKEKLKTIVKGSYLELKKKEKLGSTKQSTVNEMVKLIERVIKNGN